MHASDTAESCDGGDYCIVHVVGCVESICPAGVSSVISVAVALRTGWPASAPVSVPEITPVAAGAGAGAAGGRACRACVVGPIAHINPTTATISTCLVMGGSPRMNVPVEIWRCKDPRES